MGLIVAARTLDQSRPGVGAQAVGIAQGALDQAMKFARRRVQSGQPIIQFQAIQHMLADMATQTEAAAPWSTALPGRSTPVPRISARPPPWPRYSHPMWP
jgi:alkylation response protein AidB-like acyl-CoA dehydrogenase